MITNRPKSKKIDMRERRRVHLLAIFISGILFGFPAAVFTGYIAPRQMFGEYIPSPNMANNGFLFVPADGQHFHYYKIDGASRKQYLGLIHHTERTAIVERYFAPLRR
jgi:hypothetical protein